MSAIYYLNWEQDDVIWNSEDRNWNEVYIIIQDLLEQSGARDPQYWGDHPYDLLDDDQKYDAIKDQLQHNLDRMSQHKKSKLIEVMVTMGDAKFSNKAILSGNIKITADDVRLIARKCTVEILNIKG